MQCASTASGPRPRLGRISISRLPRAERATPGVIWCSRFGARRTAAKWRRARGTDEDHLPQVAVPGNDADGRVVGRQEPWIDTARGTPFFRRTRRAPAAFVRALQGAAGRMGFIMSRASTAGGGSAGHCVGDGDEIRTATDDRRRRRRFITLRAHDGPVMTRVPIRSRRADGIRTGGRRRDRA